jgi:hypothetical protein
VAEVDDGYDAYYAERLWQLLPAVYRAADTDGFVTAGPLRELLNRIGAQVAVVRRSIDQLWADQSIETCDDWVIPYLADLVGTNLVTSLDPRAQRLDVAKTIYYRRRKGTFQVLEEIAMDVTGWTACISESFRRLARTRHGLDPVLGPAFLPRARPAEVAQLLRTEGLTGLLTGGPAGGFADLRSSQGAALTGTAFDESFHLADVRAGRGALGHFGISRLLVFLWRLMSFPVVGGTPVPVTGQPGQYVFDPTGRQVPLFLPPAPDRGDLPGYAPLPREWQVPGPLTSSLDAAITGRGTAPRRPYPDAGTPARYGLGGGWELAAVWPETGRFAVTPGSGTSAAGPPMVSYQYGFSSMIGAGPYNRGLLPDPPESVGTEYAVTGGTGLGQALVRAGTTGTVTLGNPSAPDCATYQALADPGSSAAPIVSLLVRAGPGMRPVLRPPSGSPPWVFTGGGEARLVLDGLTLCGCDIVLRGSFDTVRITGCTIDPGTAAPGSPPLARAVDGRPLAPCRIFVEADPDATAGDRGGIRLLWVDHCILGPIRTRLGGSVETLAVTDSILQGLPATAGPDFSAAAVFDPSMLVTSLLSADPRPAALRERLTDTARRDLEAYGARSLAGQRSGLPPTVLAGLNALVNGPPLTDAVLGEGVRLSPLASEPVAEVSPARSAIANRALLEESYPVALGVAALAVADASVRLNRVTVLGRIAAHRLVASDSILAGRVTVEDTQDGCVRFSAYARGSVVPRPYRSATMPADAPIFTSDSYGHPGYAQLLETADAAISGGAGGAGISAGAETGSELGAFSADLNLIKEQALLTKYAEYMPLGLMPVVVHVT